MFIIFLALPFLISSENSYRTSLTIEQFEILGEAYIIEYRNKRCFVRGGYPQDSCRRYCKQFYDYVPSLPYKNAQNLNEKTMQCQPRPFCPKKMGVSYDEKKKKCFDFFEGVYVDPINAPAPDPSRPLIPVKYICQHGKVITFKGKKDCKCDLGYTTYMKGSTGHSDQLRIFTKCNTEVPLGVYFPNFMKIYYDPEDDNFFPYPTSPDYWIEVYQYYARKAKYVVTTFFVPWEVEIVLITIPQQEMIRSSDIIWIVWITFIFCFMVVISLFEKLKTTYRQILEENETQD